MKALLVLRDRPGCLVTVREIADATGVSQPYLRKILHYLRRAGVLDAKRGYRGGFILAREPADITAFDVILAVEGESWKVGCLLHPTSRPEDVDCAVQGLWGGLRSVIEEKLRTVTLRDLPTAPE